MLKLTFLFLVITLTVFSQGFDQKPGSYKKEKPMEKQPKVVLKDAPLVSPLLIDFQIELGSKNKVLKKIGDIIQRGKEQNDVKALLSAAIILYLEESNSGKKAKITGKDILIMATDIAVQIKNPKDIIACATLWDDNFFGNDPAKSKELLKGF
jgi:hypothetical protein